MKYLLLGLGIVLLMLYCVKSKESYGSQKEVIFFSMNGCGHCQNFKPTWKALQERYSKDKAFQLVEVSVNKNPQKVRQFGIGGFPTILVVENGKSKEQYRGNRSFEDIINFIERFR